MKNKKKWILTITLITTILVITLGVTYAAFVYRENTSNQQLVLGDIYMYYNETNQLSIDNMMPSNIEKYSSFDKYIVNPIMQSQTIEKNGLYNCVWAYSNPDASSSLDEGTTAESFCKGTGTMYGMTLQKMLELSLPQVSEEDIPYLLEMQLIVSSNGSYVVNPEIATQNLNNLEKCSIFYENVGYEFDSGSDAESFCLGTGTVNGMTIGEELDDWQQRAKEQDIDFLEDGGQMLLDNDIIVPNYKIENLPYFEFTVSGKNEYNEKDIYYEVILNHGDTPEGKIDTNRIKDPSLRFALTKVNDDNTEIILRYNIKYDEINNKRIWVETIKVNTDYEISNKYHLYMWIDEDVTICGGEITDGCDYYSTGETNNWADVFASVKVGVKGDFIEKEIQLEYNELYDVTDETCFETIVVPYYIHNTNMTDEEINKCVTIFEDEWQNHIAEDETWENFCNGTGTRYDKTFQNTLDYSGSFNDEALIYLEENNIIILNGSAVEITAYDSSCGTQVVIPESINGYDKIKIGNRAFGYSNLRNVIFSNSVIAIGERAFYNGNYLTSVTIPDSVIFLVCDSFASDVIINKNDNLVCTEGLG